MQKLILLDRDGVINYDSLEYIKSPQEFIFLPGSCEAIARLTQLGYRIGIATNQSGVTRGFYDEQALAEIHRKMILGVEACGGYIHHIEYCPHLPEKGCYCRKPNPGMLQSLAQRFGLTDLNGVPFVGDRVSDIVAAKAVGATPILVLSSMTDLEALKAHPDVAVYPSLLAVVDALVP